MALLPKLPPIMRLSLPSAMLLAQLLALLVTLTLIPAGLLTLLISLQLDRYVENAYFRSATIIPIVTYADTDTGAAAGSATVTATNTATCNATLIVSSTSTFNDTATDNSTGPDSVNHA